jgi:hypothetical protein
MTRRETGKEDWEDDGRTIVNMNVEGMPGYRRDLDTTAVARAPEQKRPKEQLSSRETRMVLFASMKGRSLLGSFSLIMVLLSSFASRSGLHKQVSSYAMRGENPRMAAHRQVLWTSPMGLYC